MIPQGYLALVLRHHLPYDGPGDAGGPRLLDAILDRHLPLVDAWRRLERDRVPFSLTLAVSPCLTAALGDPGLPDRLAAHVRHRAADLDDARRRARDDAARAVIRGDRKRLDRLAALFRDELGGDLLGEWRRLQEAGHLEPIATTATHAPLPALASERAAVRAQIAAAVDEHRRVFGRPPPGLHPAAGAWQPGAEDLLADAGLRYAVIAAGALLRASSRPVAGVHAPIALGNTGVAAFACDPDGDLSRAPACPEYRLSPTALWRVTDSTPYKDLYDPEAARRRADAEAAAYLDGWAGRARALRTRIDRPPLSVAVFDLDPPGGGWFEAPWFLEALFRHLHAAGGEIVATTPATFLAIHPVMQAARPDLASDDPAGFAAPWCRLGVDWLPRHLHLAAERMVALARRFPAADGLLDRALRQAARELLLAQSGDWPAALAAAESPEAVDQAIRRLRDHLSAFHRLHDALLAAANTPSVLDEAWLSDRESRWPLFPTLDYRVYAR